MASLYILNKLYKRLAPNTFVPAITNADILVSGISKFVVEHTLLKTEMAIYNGVFLLPLLTPMVVETKPAIILPFLSSVLITLPVIYGVPAYRTYKSVVNKNLQIIDFEKVN